MKKKSDFDDIRFKSIDRFVPSGVLVPHGKVISLASKISLNGLECFDILADWFEKHPTNKSEDEGFSDIDYKNSLRQELSQLIKFEIDFYELKVEEGDNTYHSSLVEIKQISLLLWQIIKSDFEIYKKYRSFFLEKVTYNYIKKLYKIDKRKIFFEPKVFLKRAPIIPKNSVDFSLNGYSPHNIKVDFMFKTKSVLERVYAFECKANIVLFKKSISTTTKRGISARRKLYYLECIKKYMMQNIDKSSDSLQVFFTTFVDFPEKYLFKNEHFNINANIVKASDMAKILF